MRTRGLALLLLALGPGFRAGTAVATPAPPASDAAALHCAALAQPTPVGLKALRAACPGVGAAIERLGQSAWLPARWQQIITPHALLGLNALAQHYSAPPPSPPPDAAALRTIAQDLVPPPPPADWWTRLRQRARHWLAPLVHRLRHWADSLAQDPVHATLAHALLYTLAGLLLLVIVAIAFLGLHPARRIGPRRGRGTRRSMAGPGVAPTPTDASGGPDWGRLRQTPSDLLRLLVADLVSAQRIGRERHLTCRELAAQARFDSSQQRADFEQLAQVAERALYGEDTSTPVPESLLHAAESLHTELLAPAAPTAGVP